MQGFSNPYGERDTDYYIRKKVVEEPTDAFMALMFDEMSAFVNKTGNINLTKNNYER